jgi:hypothetical protein
VLHHDIGVAEGIFRHASGMRQFRRGDHAGQNATLVIIFGVIVIFGEQEQSQRYRGMISNYAS